MTTSGWSRAMMPGQSVRHDEVIVSPQPGKARFVTRAAPVAWRAAARPGSVVFMTLSPITRTRRGSAAVGTRPIENSAGVGAAGGAAEEVGAVDLTVPICATLAGPAGDGAPA